SAGVKTCFGAVTGLDGVMIFYSIRLQARRVVFAAVFAALFFAGTTGYSFTAIYAFGDSLTGTGRNTPGRSGYLHGGVLNGAVVDRVSFGDARNSLQRLEQSRGFGQHDFGFGGADRRDAGVKQSAIRAVCCVVRAE